MKDVKDNTAVTMKDVNIIEFREYVYSVFDNITQTLWYGKIEKPLRNHEPLWRMSACCECGLYLRLRTPRASNAEIFGDLS